MQSLTSNVFMALLRLVFHSPLADSTKLSDTAGKITKEKKLKYRPSEEFEFSVHCHNGVKYEKLRSRNRDNDRVILMIHGGSFKVGLIVPVWEELDLNRLKKEMKKL